MRGMKIVSAAVSRGTLTIMAQETFGNLVKAVVDVEKQIMAVDGDLHADEEKFLLQEGSKQDDLWGINLYPGNFGTESFIEYDSMINLRPSRGNSSRGVDDEKVRAQIKSIVGKLVRP